MTTPDIEAAVTLDLEILRSILNEWDDLLIDTPGTTLPQAVVSYARELEFLVETTESGPFVDSVRKELDRIRAWLPELAVINPKES